MCVQICILLHIVQDIQSDVKIDCLVSKDVNSHTVGQGSVHDCDLAEEHAHMEALQQQAGSN